jgi:hypothetical protein
MFVSAGEIICLVALLASPRPESHTSSACLRGSLANVSIRARVEEILAAGAERAEITVEQVLRELAVLGFSGIGKVVRWRPEPPRPGTGSAARAISTAPSARS